MELALIGVAALLASGLTLFSGFGLGTILMPVFALFFPVPLAIAATAVVHGADNLFKFGLMARHASWQVVARFGIPAAIAAILGAASLTFFDWLPAAWHGEFLGMSVDATPVKVVVGVLIILFSLLEFSPRFQTKMIHRSRSLALGGVLSGFFGGLSGHQGALRAAFLVKAGLSKEGYIATSAATAVVIDFTRIVVYGIAAGTGPFASVRDLVGPVVVGMLCAFVGALTGKRLLHKVTLRTVQRIVAVFMLAVGVGLVLGKL